VSAIAEERPLLCIVDDLQWVDEASAGALVFVARRLLADPVALVFAVREPSEGHELPGLPGLSLQGLDEADARALLETVVPGRLDALVRDRIVAETRGNPLALLELPRGMSAAELAGGFAAPAAVGLAGNIEDGFVRRLEALPADTRRMLQLAAADRSASPCSCGERPTLSGSIRTPRRPRSTRNWSRSAPRSLPSPARSLGCVPLGIACRAPCAARGARRGHRRRAASRPARMAPRAGGLRTRGGGRRGAGTLGRRRPGPRRHRGRRRVPRDGSDAHARARRARAPPPRGGTGKARRRRARRRRADAERSRGRAGVGLAGAEVEHLRRQIAFDQRRAGDAARLLGDAARRLEPLDLALSRATHLETLGAAIWAADLDRPGTLIEVGEAARAAPSAPNPAGPVDTVLDALAVRLTDGYAAGAPALQHALRGAEGR
jgi:hypothetical protein